MTLSWSFLLHPWVVVRMKQGNEYQCFKSDIYSVFLCLSLLSLSYDLTCQGGIFIFWVIKMYESLRNCPCGTHYWMLSFVTWWKMRRFPWWLRWKRICFQCGRSGFDPWVRKILWRRKRQPTPVFLSGKLFWTEEPGGLQFMGSGRVGHNWVTNTYTHTHRKGNMNSETLPSHLEYFSWLTIDIKTSGTDTNI